MIWWFQPEKYEFVSWDEITQLNEKNHVPNQQPAFNDTFCQMIYIRMFQTKTLLLAGFRNDENLGKTSTFLGFGGYRDRMPKRILGVMSSLSGVECTPIMILDSFADVHICTASD